MSSKWKAGANNHFQRFWQ